LLPASADFARRLVAGSPAFVTVLAVVSMFALPRAFTWVDFDVKDVALFMDNAVLEIEGEQLPLKAEGEHAGVGSWSSC